MDTITKVIKFLAENKTFAIYVAIIAIIITLSVVGIISMLVSNMPIWMKLYLLFS